MTAIDFAIEEWPSTTFGKAARITIAALGIITATLTLMLSAMVEGGAWALVLAGVLLAATSVRAARLPSATRLIVVAANLILIPLLTRIV